jgi:hypothetical protein
MHPFPLAFAINTASYFTWTFRIFTFQTWARHTFTFAITLILLCARISILTWITLLLVQRITTVCGHVATFPNALMLWHAIAMVVTTFFLNALSAACSIHTYITFCAYIPIVTWDVIVICL